MTDSPPDLTPLVVEVELAATRQAAFAAFTRDFGEWWPVATHSLARAPTTRCRFEAHGGGRIVETGPGGEVQTWGAVLAIESPRRIRFSWHPGREPESAQWVEALFEPSGQGCRLRLTHGGWEALGEIAPLLRAQYLPGWRHVLGTVFREFVDRPGRATGAAPS